MNVEENRLPRQGVWLVVTRGVSSLGTTLTTFGLDVWVYRETGSYAIFAYLALIAMLPNLLLAPFTGLLVDRCNKRTLLLACELASMAAVLTALGLFHFGLLGVPAVALVMLALALAGAVRWMVLGVTISIIVPPASRGRINGLQQSFQGLATILAPTLGALGLAVTGLPTLLAVGAITCAAAALALVGLRAEALQAPRRNAFEYAGFWREATHGLRWVFGHPALSRLMLFFMFFNLGVSVFSVVFTPYLLAFSTSSLLGYSLAAQGAGAFFAGLALARWKGRMNPEANVLGGALVFGMMMLVWGLTRNSGPLMALAALAGALTSFIMASSQTIWQAHVPVDIQGKVFSARMMVSFSLGPVAVLASVPVATYAFGPVLVGQSWAASIWGMSAAGELGMMVSVLGALVVAGCSALFLRGGLTVPAASDAAVSARAPA